MTTTKLNQAPPTARTAGSQQRMVRRLVKDWRAIAKKKEAFAKSANKHGRESAALRANGIASAFRYCATRLEYEMTPNGPDQRPGGDKEKV